MLFVDPYTFVAYCTQGQTGRVFQLRVGSGSGIEKIFRVGSGRVGYRVFVSNTKSIGYYGVLKS